MALNEKRLLKNIFEKVPKDISRKWKIKGLDTEILFDWNFLMEIVEWVEDDGDDIDIFGNCVELETESFASANKKDSVIKALDYLLK